MFLILAWIQWGGRERDWERNRESKYKYSLLSARESDFRNINWHQCSGQIWGADWGSDNEKEGKLWKSLWRVTDISDWVDSKSKGKGWLSSHSLIHPQIHIMYPPHARHYLELLEYRTKQNKVPALTEFKNTSQDRQTINKEVPGVMSGEEKRTW